MCERIEVNGRTLFVCRGHRGRKRRCSFCSNVATLLCDMPVSGRKTCDKPLCPRCAVCLDGQDFCPTHEAIPAADLFGEQS